MEQICETCCRYRQHYIKRGYRYEKLGSGHCTYPRGKLRYGDTPACKNYKMKEEKAD